MWPHLPDQEVIIIKKILIGGSPCTHWSIAQKNNRETKAEGLGWELFKNYLIAKEKFKPDFFLYENNKSAAQPIKEQISRELDVELQYINSSLVSAQNRQRFYAHNIPNVPQPEDRGIFLKDILESGIPCRNEKAYCLDVNYYKGGNLTSFNKQSGQRLMVAEPICVAQRGRYSTKDGSIEQHFEARNDGKTNVLTTVTKDNLIAEPLRIGSIGSDSQAHRVYSVYGKSINLVANGGGQGAKTGLYAVPVDKSFDAQPVYTVVNGMISINEKIYPIKLPDGYYIIRKLIVTEAARLQMMPDDYCRAVSNSQAYKCLGNGWTAEVIIHILKHMNIPRDEELLVLSMYDGIATGRYCFDKMGYKNIRYAACEIDKFAIKVANSNYSDNIQLGDAFQVRDEQWSFEDILFNRAG